MTTCLHKERLSLYPAPTGAIVYSGGVWNIPEGIEIDAFQEGIFIVVPDGKVVQNPLEIIYQLDGSQAAPWVHIVVGRNSSVSVREKIVAQKPSSMNAMCTVSIQEGGSLSHTLLEPFFPHVESSFSFRAFLEQGASLSCVSATALPNSTKRSEIYLEGRGASAHFKELSLAGRNKEHTTSVTIEHRGEESVSSQLFKGVVAGSSRVESSVVMRGQRSKSQQLSRFLVVDDMAKTSNRPNMSVFADDVEATHGATTGRLEDEALYYLKTRGLPEQEALSLCIHGFCREIVDLFPEKDLLEAGLEEMLV